MNDLENKVNINIKEIKSSSELEKKSNELKKNIMI